MKQCRCSRRYLVLAGCESSAGVVAECSSQKQKAERRRYIGEYCRPRGSRRQSVLQRDNKRQCTIESEPLSLLKIPTMLFEGSFAR